MFFIRIIIIIITIIIIIIIIIMFSSHFPDFHPLKPGPSSGPGALQGKKLPQRQYFP